MAGIGGVGWARGGQGARGAARPGGAFRLPGVARSAEAAGAAPTAAAAPIGLLAMHGADEAAERDRRGAARARDLLRELSALQAGLLRGTVDPDGLARIALLAEGESPEDPVLRDALTGIALRARVELARRGIMVAGT
ncbi:flagellar assembly protein FliX [Pararoseomonas sp. SCSIO 73927]|uniref:flagellar assembly protein FliX n=1 Tax=Pararoseomonas sp. SCSIO 73927 TaxID=3114537 RepID=UPI0030D21CCD